VLTRGELQPAGVTSKCLIHANTTCLRACRWIQRDRCKKWKSIPHPSHINYVVWYALTSPSLSHDEADELTYTTLGEVESSVDCAE
jgi:hypothetical protein